LKCVRRKRLEVPTDVESSDDWAKVRKASRLDNVLKTQETQSLATGAAAVSVTRAPGQIPKVELVNAENLTAYDDVTIEHVGGKIIVNDMREVAWPIWRVYDTRLMRGV